MAKQYRKKRQLTARKAKEILKDGTAHGKPITKKQKGFFGLIAGGKDPYDQP